MTDPSMNASDPVADEASPRIGPVDLSLPEPPDHEDIVDEAEQAEPEDTELPEAEAEREP